MLLKNAVIISIIGMVYGRSNYRDGMPNGYSVPNPCGTSVAWDPVGHFNPIHHTLLKNSFGQEYSVNGQSWALICNLDSDKDGMTNGFELGDPNCAWRTGQLPAGPAIGHPGICEPVGSTQCAWQNFRCDCLEHCPGLVAFP